MVKFWKFFEYAYLVIAIIFIVEGVARWSSDKNRAYLFIGFAVLAVFMYFFRKRFRKRIEARNKEQNK
jgi:LPXTG-motif cell wall-anchored protein